MSLLLNNLYRFDDFVLDPANRSLARNGTPIPLSAKSCQVLTYLVANPGRVVTKDELLKAVWPESFVEESNLPGYISGLRKALGDRSILIATVPGLGYKFTGSVETEAPANSNARAEVASLEVQQMRETTRVVIRESTTTSPAIVSRETRFPHRAAWAALATVTLLTAAAAYVVHRRAEPQQLSKVIVGDFLNLTGDPDFDRVLKSSLELSIAQSPYIQLISSGEVKSTLGMMKKASDSPLLGDLAIEVCRRENYQALLRGKISPATKWGSDAVSLEVVNCLTGKTITEFHADAMNKDKVLDTLDGLALRARSKLGESAASIGEFNVPIANASTFSFEALQDVNTGIDLGNQGKLLECISYFQKAVDLDPKFAMAWVNLSTAYTDLGDAEKAEADSKKAFDLSDGVTQAERLSIRYTYHAFTLSDLDAGLKDLEEWTRVYPRDSAAWQNVGYIDVLLGDYPAAARATERSIQLNPLKYEAGYGNLASIYKRNGRFADAKRAIAESQAQNQDGVALHEMLLEIAFLEHDPQAMQRETQWAADRTDKKWAMLEPQALLAATLGKVAESESLYQQAMQDAIQEKQPALADNMKVDEAGAEVELGESARAIKLLDQVKSPEYITWVLFAARAGETAPGEAFLKLPNAYPYATIRNKVLYPELKAILALHRNDPQTAIAELESTRPYELGSPQVIDLRAQAYLMAKQGDKAAAEYQKLIDHPAIQDPTMPMTYLAHLGLARAYALSGRRPESRKEYETFFSLWKDADPGSLTLHQARAEFNQL